MNTPFTAARTIACPVGRELAHPWLHFYQREWLEDWETHFSDV